MDFDLIIFLEPVKKPIQDGTRNEEILNERNVLLRIEKSYKENKKLTPKELEKLEAFAIKYDYFTRETEDTRIGLQIQNLKNYPNAWIGLILFISSAISRLAILSS